LVIWYSVITNGYKFSYVRNGWEKLSIYNIAKEVNLHLMNELKESLLGIPLLTRRTYQIKYYRFLNKNSITVLLITTWINSKHSSTPKNFIYGMDKNYVLRFEDCIYDFNKKASRPGRPSNFCLKSTNHLIYFYSGINSLHIEIHIHVDIF